MQREEEGVAGSQPISTAVHRGPNKLWRSNSIFTYGTVYTDILKGTCKKISILIFDIFIEWKFYNAFVERANFLLELGKKLF
jgi:hypothetical protein